LLRNRAQHVAGTRDLRQIDFGFDFFFAAGGGARGLAGARSGFAAGPQMLPNQIRFMLFQRTGVRLLFRNSNRGQRVKNFLALDL
jgi:hypothetical protein